MPLFRDKKGRTIPREQLKAIFAKANMKGVSDTNLNKTKITTLNDEIIAIRGKQRGLHPIDAINPALDNLIAKREIIAKPRTVKDIVKATAKTNQISEEQAKRDLTVSNVIPAGISEDAVIGASKEEQYNQLKRKLQQKTFEKASRELVEEEIKKSRKGTVAEVEREQVARKEALKSGRFQAGKKPVDKKKLIELREKLKDEQAKRKILDKITAKQEELIETNQIQIEQKEKAVREKIKEAKRNENELKKKQELIERLRKAKQSPNIPTQPIHGIGAKEVKGKTIGVGPMAFDIKEAEDKQFQLQKTEFELRKLGYSPGLAHERAKVIMQQRFG